MTKIVEAENAVGVMCVLTMAESVRCLGSDELFAVTGSQILADPPYPGRYRALSLGNLSYCTISVDNEAFCWGGNEYGQLLPDTTATKISKLVLIDRNVSSIAVGGSYGCAVFTDGTARCWGRDLFGNPVTPDTSGIGPIETIALGTLASWILTRDGKVWPLGPTHPVTGAPAAGPVKLGFKARSLEVGFDHACVLDGNGGVWCWGSNADGQLGLGEEGASYDPVRVFP